MNTIHINPIKHGYGEKILDWLYSTFHRYIELGVYPGNLGSVPELELDIGAPRR
jgi:putative transposase